MMTSDLFEKANRFIWDTYRCECRLVWNEGGDSLYCFFVGKRPKRKQKGRPRADADHDRSFVAHLFDNGRRLVVFEQDNIAVFNAFRTGLTHNVGDTCQSNTLTTPTPAAPAS